MFIVAAVQHIKIGDLTAHTSGMSYSSEDDDMNMHVDQDYGKDSDTPVLSKEEERSLVRDSTASFAGDFSFSFFVVTSKPLSDWVTMLVRRVLALYENLPEEGGKKNTTGGKQEESMLKSIKSMMDVVCLHLSDQLFDLVLNLLFDYATANAKSNAVQAFGQLIACLARVKPEQVMAKFLSPCISQVEEELKHGASSVRTTSTHAAVSSDTTLHWSKPFPPLRSVPSNRNSQICPSFVDALDMAVLPWVTFVFFFRALTDMIYLYPVVEV